MRWGKVIETKLGHTVCGEIDLEFTQQEIVMVQSFKEALEVMVEQRIAAGEAPQDLFEELMREANLVFGHYSLEYELGLIKKQSSGG
jgi:hypothetical protein